MDNKRKLEFSDDKTSKKIKRENNEFNFDGKIKLNEFNEYLDEVNLLKNSLNELVKKKKEDKLKDDNSEIKSAKRDIKSIKHNLYYNIYHLNKLKLKLEEYQNTLKDISENLCDHDIYSECEYHNDRYYYCKKCSYER